MSCSSGSCTPAAPAPEAGDGRPLTIADLTAADQWVIRGARHVATVGRRNAPLEDLAEALIPGAGRSPALHHLADFLAILEDPEGPEIALRRPPCKGLTGDEVALARTLAAVRDNDFAAAQAYIARLASPSRAGVALAAAFALSCELAGFGQGFTFQAPAVAGRGGAAPLC